MPMEIIFNRLCGAYERWKHLVPDNFKPPTSEDLKEPQIDTIYVREQFADLKEGDVLPPHLAQVVVLSQDEFSLSNVYTDVLDRETLAREIDPNGKGYVFLIKTSAESADAHLTRAFLDMDETKPALGTDTLLEPDSGDDDRLILL